MTVQAYNSQLQLVLKRWVKWESTSDIQFWFLFVHVTFLDSPFNKYFINQKSLIGVRLVSSSIVDNARQD